MLAPALRAAGVTARWSAAIRSQEALRPSTGSSERSWPPCSRRTTARGSGASDRLSSGPATMSIRTRATQGWVHDGCTKGVGDHRQNEPVSDPVRPLPRPARSTSGSARRSRRRAGATSCSTTPRCPTPTTTSGCGGSRTSRRSSPSSAPPTRRPRRSAARSRPSSPRSSTCSGWRASTTPSPTTSSRPGTRGWPATASRTRTCSASSRSTGWPSTCSTRRAGWSGRSPAATGSPARTSRPTSRRSTRCRTG